MSQPAFPGHLSPADPDLTDRQREVFQALVSLHGHSARPVGSEALAQHTRMGLSPASIRAALAELEGMGLLERHHSSAARVPSASGFEYFVRALLRPAELPPAVIEEIDRSLLRSAGDVERLLNEASRVLSSLTHQLGLAVAAALDDERLVRIDLERLGDQRAFLALGLGGGAVLTLVLDLESRLDYQDLAEVAGVLRERLVGRALREVRERLRDDPELVRRSAVRLVARAAAESWARTVSTPLFSAGVVHIAEQPEFSTSGTLGPILRAVESGSPLDRLLVVGVEGHASVRVGLDEDRALMGCSLVSYSLPGSVRASVGVLGPLRMDYSHALAVVDSVGLRLSQLLDA